MIVMAAVMFTIGTIRYGTGSLAYPISYLGNGQHAYTTLGRYLLNGFLIQSLAFLFILVYLFILSMWRNNSFEILGFACVTLLFPLVFSKKFLSYTVTLSGFLFTTLMLRPSYTPIMLCH